MPVKYRLTVFISWGNFKDELYKSYIENLKDSQICNIRSETKFGQNHDPKLWLNDFQANCFPT